MSENIEIINAKREHRGVKHEGQLKLQKSSLSFTQKSSKNPLKIEKSKISSAGYFKQPKSLNCLRIMSNDGSVERFPDLSENDINKIIKYISTHYGIDVNTIKMSISGSNCGKLEFEGNSMMFKVQGNTAFEIPLNNVSHSSHTRSEVVTEFHQNENSEVSLVEMRFHIPPTTANDAEFDAAEGLHNSIMTKADVIKPTGGSIASFTELYCLTPRGRFDVRLYNSFLQLRGKTVDYKISYSSILRTFLLPNSLTRSVFYVIYIDPPIKQGQTRYPYLVFQFDQDDHSDIELTLNDEIEHKCSDGRLSKHMSGEISDLFSKIISVLIGCKIIKPETFENYTGGKSIACSFKVNSGYLFPLDRGLIFVHKPTLYFRYDELSHVGFDRSSTGETKSFDFYVKTKLAPTSYVFAGMLKSDYEQLSSFVSQKNLSVRVTEPKQTTLPVINDSNMIQGADSSDELESSGLDSDDEDINVHDLSEHQSSSSEHSDSHESASSVDETKIIKSSSVKRKKKSKKGEKQKKDPTKPKKAMTAYMLWLSENRPRIKRENPSLNSVIDIVKHASTLWHELNDKTKWENMAMIAKEEYTKAITEWKLMKECEGMTKVTSPVHGDAQSSD